MSDSTYQDNRCDCFGYIENMGKNPTVKFWHWVFCPWCGSKLKIVKCGQCGSENVRYNGEYWICAECTHEFSQGFLVEATK